MDKKTLILIFVFTLIPFLFYFNSGTFIDGDSYYYLNAVCNNGANTASSHIFWIITDLLPCNFFIIKLIYWFVYFLSVFILTKLVSLFSKNYIYTPLLVSATFLCFEFMKFENDAFGFLFGFLGIYLYFKNTGFRRYLSLIPLFVAFLFWEGAGYWIIIMPWLFLTYSLFFFEKIFWFALYSDIKIIEHTPWIGFMNYGLILPLFYIGFLNTKEMKIKLCFIALILINVFISKLWILSLPFGLIIAVKSIDFLKEKWNMQIKNYVIIAGIVFCLFSSYHVLSQPFTQNDVDLIQEGIILACQNNDCLIQNDFSAGHTIIFYGGKTNQKSGTTEWKYEGITIDINSIKQEYPVYCKKIRETKYFRLLDCNQ